MIVTQFMLTKNDVTIPDAFEVYEQTRADFTAEELPYVGFKNIGHPLDRLRELGEKIVSDGRRLVIEIVGASADTEREAALLAVELGADLLIGGTHTETVLEVIKNTGIGYYPTVGDLSVEPGRIHGTIEEIASQATDMIATPGVDGIMLLGYRYVGNVPELIKTIGEIPNIKIVNAGTVDSAERIAELEANNYWAFTIGSAVLDRSLPAGPTLKDQLQWVLDTASKN